MAALEIIEACAAVAGIAVAGGTGWLAWETRNLGAEDFRARIDGNSHRVTIYLDEVREPYWWEPSTLGASGDPQPFEARGGFDRVSGANKWLLARAFGLIVNESSVSTNVAVPLGPRSWVSFRFLELAELVADPGDLPRGEALRSIVDVVERTGGSFCVPPQLQMQRYALPPRSVAAFCYTDGKSVSDWIAAAEFMGPGWITDQATLRQELIVRDQTPGGATDYFAIRIIAWPLVQVPGQLSWSPGRVGPGVPKALEVPRPLISVDHDKREYPIRSGGSRLVRSVRAGWRKLRKTGG